MRRHGFGTSLLRAANAVLLIRRRKDEIMRLTAMNDGELADIGLTRAAIPDHVFGTRMREIWH